MPPAPAPRLAPELPRGSLLVPAASAPAGDSDQRWPCGSSLGASAASVLHHYHVHRRRIAGSATSRRPSCSRSWSPHAPSVRSSSMSHSCASSLKSRPACHAQLCHAICHAETEAHVPGASLSRTAVDISPGPRFGAFSGLAGCGVRCSIAATPVGSSFPFRASVVRVHLGSTAHLGPAARDPVRRRKRMWMTAEAHIRPRAIRSAGSHRNPRHGSVGSGGKDEVDPYFPLNTLSARASEVKRELGLNFNSFPRRPEAVAPASAIPPCRPCRSRRAGSRALPSRRRKSSARGVRGWIPGTM